MRLVAARLHRHNLAGVLDHETTHHPSNPARPLRLHSHRDASRHCRDRDPDCAPASGRPGGRESARRIQCAGNLKQLALACHNYAAVHGTLPIGIPRMYDPDPSLNFFHESQSIFVSMLGQLDQQPLFNAVNFSRSIFASANATIYATGLRSCGAPATHRSRWKSSTRSSRNRSRSRSGSPVTPAARGHCTRTCKLSRPTEPARVAQFNGPFTADRGIPFAGITDGTSQTMLLSERATGS